MTELTDLGICKRIAEIEGITIAEYNGTIVDVPKSRVTMNCHYAKLNEKTKSAYHKIKSYNPLTDDALCFKLMIKHKVLITWNPQINNNCTAVIDGRSEDILFPFSIAINNNANPNKAICLAIIEANK